MNPNTTLAILAIFAAISLGIVATYVIIPTDAYGVIIGKGVGTSPGYSGVIIERGIGTSP